MLENMFEKALNRSTIILVELMVKHIILPLMLKISDFEGSDRDLHHRFDNYIIILRKFWSEE